MKVKNYFYKNDNAFNHIKICNNMHGMFHPLSTIYRYSLFMSIINFMSNVFYSYIAILLRL